MTTAVGATLVTMVRPMLRSVVRFTDLVSELVLDSGDSVPMVRFLKLVSELLLGSSDSGDSIAVVAGSLKCQSDKAQNIWLFS